MKRILFKNTLLPFLIIFICMIQFPYSFAKSTLWEPVLSNTSKVASNRSLELYNKLQLKKAGLSEKAFLFAIEGFEKIKQSRTFNNDHIISIIDFTKASSKKRLFVVDIENEMVLFNTYVAHGQHSGKRFATNFSNTAESLQSSLGFYETSQTYFGKNGYSLQLIGLEKGINDNANERSIVMHGAPYVCEQFIKSNGYLGRSWGCPAVPEDLTKPIINTIKNGTCLFIYANDQHYLNTSVMFKS